MKACVVLEKYGKDSLSGIFNNSLMPFLPKICLERLNELAVPDILEEQKII